MEKVFGNKYDESPQTATEQTVRLCKVEALWPWLYKSSYDFRDYDRIELPIHNFTWKINPLVDLQNKVNNQYS